MKSFAKGALALALVLGTASLAGAQTQSPAPAPAPTTGTGGAGAPGTSAQAPERDIDLPLEQPALNSAKPKPPAPNPPTPVDNPTTPPPTFFGKDIKSETATIFYVIDVSGSMGWDMGTFTGPDGTPQNGCRLDRAKAELIKSVMSLPKNFKFNMLSYDCSVYQWQSGMQPADDAHKQDALNWINNLQPQGATGTGPAVVNALSDRDNKLVVLLTDGGPNCGAGNGEGGESCRQAHRQMIDQSNTQHAVINVFGISATGGMKQFCMDIAADNGGTYTDVQ